MGIARKKLPRGYLILWLIFAAAYLIWTCFFLHWDTYPQSETGIFSAWIYPVWIAFSTCLLLLFPLYMQRFLYDDAEKANRIFALVMLIVDFVFITFYCFLKDPRQYTASMIGLEYPWCFKAWGVLSTTAVFVNMLYMYRKYDFTSRVGLVAGSVGCAALFITINVPSAGEELILNSLRCMSHWTGALLFAFGTAIPIVIFLCHMSRTKDNRFLFLTVFVCAVLAVSLTLLVVVGKDGLIEGVPVWAVYLVMLLVNFTPLFPDPYKQDAPAKKQTVSV